MRPLEDHDGCPRETVPLGTDALTQSRNPFGIARRPHRSPRLDKSRTLFGDGYAQDGFAQAAIQVCPETLVETIGSPDDRHLVIRVVQQMRAGFDSAGDVRAL